MSVKNNDKYPIVVVASADDNYAMPVAVMARSAIENLKSDRHMLLFIIDGGIKPHNKHKIEKSLDLKRCDLRWLKPLEGSFEGIEVKRHVTTTAFMRLLIPDLLPNQFQKVIYLDCDLVINQDLSQLWEIDMGENYLLAVQDYYVPYVSSPLGLAKYQELGIPADCKYFNSGVLVINLEKWRTNEISFHVVEYLRQSAEYRYCNDQEGMNVVLANKWGELDPRWNQLPKIYKYTSWKDSSFSEEMYYNLIHNPYIIHFATSLKPWQFSHKLTEELYYKSIGKSSQLDKIKHPARHLFFHYLDMTVWSGWRLTIWRRLWLRLLKETRKIKIFVPSPKTS